MHARTHRHTHKPTLTSSKILKFENSKPKQYALGGIHLQSVEDVYSRPKEAPLLKGNEIHRHVLSVVLWRESSPLILSIPQQYVCLIC